VAQKIGKVALNVGVTNLISLRIFFNYAVDIYGKPLSPEYKGGVFCCENHFQCKLKKGFQAPNRKIALRYKITWVDWDQHQIPVRFYVLDSTDHVRTNGSETIHDCLVNKSFKFDFF
jgi:hypothetical protein